MKVLIVDDSKSIREFISSCVVTMGHQPFYAENGNECVEFIENNNVDLVLMDIEMPGMDGLEATKAIRELRKDDWFPIVFLSAKVDDETFTNGILSGGDAYMSKPIEPLRLQLTIVAMERIYDMRQKLYNTQKKLLELNKDLERLSYFDELTGLANRRSFDQTLDKQFRLSRRSKLPLSLVICDIDFFKLYNDSYGHQMGDDCLAIVAQAIGAAMTRPMDTACRYGGEEFTVILPETDITGAGQMAERMRMAVLDKKIPHSGSKVNDCVSLSLGVACHTGQFQTVDDLLKAADDALYSAKENGRNRVEFDQ